MYEYVRGLVFQQNLVAVQEALRVRPRRDASFACSLPRYWPASPTIGGERKILTMANTLASRVPSMIRVSSKLTSKAQTTIPPVRVALHMEPSDELVYEMVGQPLDQGAGLPQRGDERKAVQRFVEEKVTGSSCFEVELTADRVPDRFLAFTVILCQCGHLVPLP